VCQSSVQVKKRKEKHRMQKEKHRMQKEKHRTQEEKLRFLFCFVFVFWCLLGVVVKTDNVACAAAV
jgi:uncharacterized ion transporter superfamily protein YfcC